MPIQIILAFFSYHKLTKSHQSSLSGIYTYVGMTLMSHFILVYLAFEAQRVLDETKTPLIS